MYQLVLNEQVFETTVLMDILRTINARDINRGTAHITVSRDGQPLAVVLNGYGKYGIQQEGNIRDLFLQMLDEVEIAYIRPRGTEIQPWEMLPHEWETLNILGSSAFNVYPCFTSTQRREQIEYTDAAGNKTSGLIEYFMMAEMIRRFGYNHNGPLCGRERISNSRHDVQVAYALAEGKPVPKAIIAWYQENYTPSSDLRWFKTLLDWPEYRGTMSANKLSALLIALRDSGITLTNENAPFFIRQMAALNKDATFEDVDDHFYNLGVIKPRTLTPSGEMPDPSTAVSPFAYTLRVMLGEHRKLDMIQQAEERFAKRHCTRRELHAQVACAELLPAYESFSYPNKFAVAVERKDIGTLLTYLDTPNDRNVTTKKAMHDVFGLKLIGLKAEERRNAIYSFCGLDAQKRKAHELEVATKAATTERENEINKVRKMAESGRIRLSTGAIVTLAEYVDQAVAEGYTCIATRKRGATKQYWLSNPQAGYFKSIQKKDGSLDYAVLIHGLSVEKLAA